MYVCGGGKGVRSKLYGRGHGFLRVMYCRRMATKARFLQQNSTVKYSAILYQENFLFYQALEPRAIIRACLLI